METLRFIRLNARWLLAGMLLTFSSSYGQTFFISVFAGSIREEFGLSHGTWGSVYALGTIASAAVMVWAGALTDTFMVRTISVYVLSLLAVSCVFMAQVNSVALLAIAIFLLRFAGQGMTSHLATVAMARWFVAARGRALSIAALGYSVGEAILPLIFVALLAVYSWRTLWIVAAVMALFALPVLLRLLKEERTPQSIAAATSAFGMNGRHWSRGAVLRHWLFWALVPSIVGPAAFGTAFFFHQVHMAEVKGWNHVELVALFPIFTGAGIVSMLVSGWAIDRFGTARLMPVFQLPSALGFVLFSISDTLAGGAFAIALMGLTVGMNSTLPGAFWAEFYGTLHLGSIKALAAALMVLGSAIGPGITGFVIDAGINFEDQMFGIAAYFLAASILIWPVIYRARAMLAAPA